MKTLEEQLRDSTMAMYGSYALCLNLALKEYGPFPKKIRRAIKETKRAGKGKVTELTFIDEAVIHYSKFLKKQALGQK